MMRPQHCGGWVKDPTDLLAAYHRPPLTGYRPCQRVRWADMDTVEGRWYCCDAHRRIDEARAKADGA